MNRMPTPAEAIHQVFGVDAESISSAIQTAAASDSVLSIVSGIVSMAALLVAVVVILLTFVNAVLQTGEHGKVGGKYSAVWVPIRTTLALALLTPLSVGGYSVVHALVLWLGLQGSHYADVAWNRSAEFVTENQGLARAQPPREAGELTAALYSIEMCQHSLNATAASGSADYSVSRPDGFAVAAGRSRYLGISSDDHLRTLSYDGAGTLEGVAGACGSITLRRPFADEPNMDALHTETLTLQANAIERLRATVNSIVQQQYDDTLTGPQVRAALKDADEAYHAAQTRASQLFNARVNAREIALRDQQLDQAAQASWITAGAYYMTFAAYSALLNRALTEPPEITGPRVSQFSPAIARDVMPWLRTAATAVPRSAAAWTETDQPAEDVQAWDDWGLKDMSVIGIAQKLASDKFWASVTQQMRDNFELVQNAGTGDGRSLIVDLSAIGHTLLTSAAGLFTLALAAGGVLTVTTGVGGLVVLGTVGPVLGVLWTVGAFLAYMLPAMPFLVWIAGVAGWLLMLVQATLAAPLWAAAHVSPDGEGFAGHRPQQGYLLLISLAARPLLMIAGLLAGMLIIEWLGGWVTQLFSIWISDSLGSNTAGPVSLLIWLLIYVGLIIMLVRWSFSLIHHVPDAVLRFIGAAGESLGESQMAEQARSMALAAYAQLKSAKSIGSGIGKLGKGSGSLKASG